MSLLDDGRDVVFFRGEVDAVDEYGTPTRVPGDPAPWPCRVQPVSSDENGQPVPFGTTYRAIGRWLPPGGWSTAEWANREWDVIGEPRRSNGSDLTRHVSVILRARAPEHLGVR